MTKNMLVQAFALKSSNPLLIFIQNNLRYKKLHLRNAIHFNS